MTNYSLKFEVCILEKRKDLFWMCWEQSSLPTMPFTRLATFANAPHSCNVANHVKINQYTDKVFS